MSDQPHQHASQEQPQAPGSTKRQTRGVMRNLGGFVGGILAGIKTQPTPDASSPQTIDRRSSTETTTGTDDAGRAITLRRTVIEEVEVRENPPASS